jgi:hypothetical protein
MRVRYVNKGRLPPRELGKEMTEWMSEVRRGRLARETIEKLALVPVPEKLRQQWVDGSWDDGRGMGPIERELRKCPPECGYITALSGVAFELCNESSKRMGIHEEFLNSFTADAEVLSEAIEAAEALGL